MSDMYLNAVLMMAVALVATLLLMMLAKPALNMWFLLRGFVSTLWFAAVVSWMVHSHAHRTSTVKSSLRERLKGWLVTLGHVAMQRTNDPDWINATEFRYADRVFIPPFTFRRVQDDKPEPPDWGI